MATKAKKKREFKGAPSAVIVAGRRTPFVKAFGPYTKMDAIELGKAAAEGVISGIGLDKKEIDAVVWGGVILPSAAPNVGREIAFDIGLPWEAEANTVTRACASGIQALTNAALMIEHGEAEVVLVGGGESTSNASVTLPAEIMHAFGPVVLSGKSGPKEYLGAVKELYPFNNIMPKRPQIAERTTGELMGESAEKMAELNQIKREDQDKLAVASHKKAAAAYEAGIFDNEVISVNNSRWRNSQQRRICTW